MGLEVAPGLVVDLLDTLKRLLFGMPVDRYVDLSEQLANSMRVQCSWHVIDRPMSGEQLRADQARHAIGDTTACSNHFWSEVTGWMRTTEFFKVGEENLLRELWSAIGAADYYAKDWEEGVENLDVARYGGPGVFRVNHSPDRFKRRWLHLEIEAC